MSISRIIIRFTPPLVIESNQFILLLQLLVKSSQSKYVFLFYRQELSTPKPFDSLTVLIHTVYSTWHISQHTFILNRLGDYVSCCHSCLYLSPKPLLSPSLLSISSVPTFPIPTSWLYPIFKILSFSLFTTRNLSLLFSSHSTNKTFYVPKVLVFASDNTSIPLICGHASIDPTYPVLKPNLYFPTVFLIGCLVILFRILFL